jgi:uncharacterized membrane protein
MAFRDDTTHTKTMQGGNRMNRFEYIATLKQAMEGMPADVIASTVTEYERRIAEASAAGKSEDEILAELENPHAVAAQRRATAQMQAFKQNKTPVNFFRLCFSLVGLMVFNLFLFVPALIYSVLLVCGYIAALACYGGGIVATSVAIAGVNEISLDNAHAVHAIHADMPNQHVQIYVKDKDGSAKVETSEDGKVSAKVIAGTAGASTTAASAASTTGGNTASADAKAAPSKPEISIGSNSVRIRDENSNIKISGDDDDDTAFGDDEHGLNFEAPGVHIYNPRYSNHVFLNADELGLSRPVQAMLGLGLTILGVIGFLLCLTISRYSILGMFRLAEMEFAVLKNA